MKNLLIAALIVLLFAVSSIAFKKNTGSSSNSSARIIPPDPPLLAAYQESSKHSALADIAELSCLPSSRFDCGPEGCSANAPKTYFLLDYGTESGTYFRCDEKGCDDYPVKVVHSGEFTQFVPILGQAMVFKVETGDSLGNKGEFIDIATLGNTEIVSFGKCELK